MEMADQRLIGEAYRIADDHGNRFRATRSPDSESRRIVPAASDREGAAGTDGRVERRTRYEVGFWIVLFAYLTVMGLGTVPSPLYGVYRQRDGFSIFTITLIFAAYSAGTVLSLFLAGSLSDWYGRKKVLIPGVLLGALSAVVFLVWRDLPGLYLGRVLSGLSVGLVSAAATAHATELHLKSRPGASIRRAQIAASTVNLAGFALGALVSGLLAQYVSAPLSTTYVVFICAFGVALVALLFCPETLDRPDPLPRYRIQGITVPAAARSQYVASLVGAFIAIAGTGLFSGLAGTFLVTTLHHTSLALIGTAIFIVFAAGVGVQFVTFTWKTRAVLATGIVTLLVGLGLVVLSAWLPTPSLAAFLIGGAVVGAGAGGIFKGSLGTVIAISEPADRAQSVAGLLLSGYLGLSLPVIGVGIALRQTSVKITLLGFTIVVASIIVAAAPALLRSHSVVNSAS
ncbi:MAG TPA: MFS transporter [Acidimicrobiales bacterium]|nr:MFS transporter [Acidimicrobiales bacterium]